jgi:hypothetical protein
MKITKNQLKQIIKEEALKLQKRTILQNRKKEILRELRVLKEGLFVEQTQQILKKIRSLDNTVMMVEGNNIPTKRSIIMDIIGKTKSEKIKKINNNLYVYLVKPAFTKGFEQFMPHGGIYTINRIIDLDGIEFEMMEEDLKNLFYKYIEDKYGNTISIDEMEDLFYNFFDIWNSIYDHSHLE